MIQGYIRYDTDRVALFAEGMKEHDVLKCRASIYLNEVDEAALTLPGTNRPARSLLQKNAIVELRDDDEIVFIGETATMIQNEYGDMRLDLDGALGWLRCVVKPPFSIKAGDQNSPVANFLAAIISQYNAGVGAERMITLGAVTISGNVELDHHDEYTTMLQLLGEVREQLGGYVYMDYATGTPTLNYVARPTAQAAQELELGVNVLTVENQLDFSDYASRVYATGSYYVTTGDKREQTPLDAGYVVDAAAEALYGRVDVAYKSSTDMGGDKDNNIPDKTQQEAREIILAEAQAILDERKVPLQSLQLTATDLKQIGVNYRLFRIGTVARAYLRALRIDTTLAVRKIERDYIDRDDSVVHFGREAATISGASFGGGSVTYSGGGSGGGSSGVSSWNGMTGAVTYTPPVTSVNGMTGDVVVPSGGGGGAVDSVNGKTGTVVLNAGDVGAVPAVSGKGLSTNDYTTSEKEKLSGIEIGAQVNVQANWTQQNPEADDYIRNKPTIPSGQVQANWNENDPSAADYIKNKPTIPVKISDLTDDSDFLKAANNSVARSYLDSDVRGSLDKADAAVLFTANQGLNSSQQGHARANIGAGTSTVTYQNNQLIIQNPGEAYKVIDLSSADVSAVTIQKTPSASTASKTFTQIATDVSNGKVMEFDFEDSTTGESYYSFDFCVKNESNNLMVLEVKFCRQVDSSAAHYFIAKFYSDNTFALAEVTHAGGGGSASGHFVRIDYNGNTADVTHNGTAITGAQIKALLDQQDAGAIMVDTNGDPDAVYRLKNIYANGDVEFEGEVGDVVMNVVVPAAGSSGYAAITRKAQVYYYLDGTTVKSEQTNYAVTGRQIQTATIDNGFAPVLTKTDSYFSGTVVYHFSRGDSYGLWFRRLDGLEEINVPWDSSTAVTEARGYNTPYYVRAAWDSSANKYVLKRWKLGQEVNVTYADLARHCNGLWLNGNLPVNRIVQSGGWITAHFVEIQFGSGGIAYVHWTIEAGSSSGVSVSRAVLNRNPVTIYRNATGLAAIEANMSADPAWQLTGLDLTPFKRIKIYTKAAQKSGTTASASTTPSACLEMLLDPYLAGPYGGHYLASTVIQKSNDNNRLATLTCAVSSDKTKFVVLRQTNLYGTGATNNNDVGSNVVRIEGYYD